MHRYARLSSHRGDVALRLLTRLVGKTVGDQRYAAAFFFAEQLHPGTQRVDARRMRSLPNCGWL